MTSARLPLFPPDALDAEQRALYEAILGGKRATGHVGVALTTPEGALVGPFNAMLLSPKVGNAVQRLGEQVRFESVLQPQVKELLILLVAAETRSPFEWYAHEAIARLQGMAESRIGEIHARRKPAALTAHEEAAWNIGRELLVADEVSDETFAAGAAVLGQRGVFEVAVLIGYYRMIAGILAAFAVAVPQATAR